MDPLSQGVVGAVVPQSFAQKNTLFWAAVIGFLSGLAPDLDIFIRSDIDPLLFLEYHRQFTHSLIFIPMGGFICASFFFILLRNKIKLPFKKIWLFATLGYGTHGLLDACTSYGTLLFWPFSDYRFAWNNISIIDPLFTIPIIILILIAAIKKNYFYSRIALLWAILYLICGVIINNKVLSIGKELAFSRGHHIEKISAKPTFGNLLLWKVIYESNDEFYTDGIRIFPNKKIYEGVKIQKLKEDIDFRWLQKTSQQYRDIQRFKWFSDDHLAISPHNSNLIIDARYSMLPNEISGLWGIELKQERNENEHIKFITNRSLSKEKLLKLWSLISVD